MHTSHLHAYVKYKDAVIAVYRLTNIGLSMHPITKKYNFLGIVAAIQPDQGTN